jgi:hypothetical protein
MGARNTVNMLPVKKFTASVPGIVVHAWNLSYSGGRDQKDCSLRPSQAKKLVRLPSQQTSLAWWWHAYNFR